MTFPTNPSNGDQYPNPDNGYLYEWQDPPAAWTVIGKIDGDGGGGTPNPPGDGIVLGTDLKIQTYPFARNHTATYTTNTISVRTDKSFATTTGTTGVEDVRFAYSYDLTNWYLGNETGGSKTGLIENIAHGDKSDGSEVFFCHEFGNKSRIWRSYNGIDWEVVAASGLSLLPDNVISVVSRDNLILIPNTSNIAQIWTSSDDGVTWTARNPGFNFYKEKVFLHNKVLAFGEGTGNGQLRISIDGGVTWGAAATGVNDFQWNSCLFWLVEDPDVLFISFNVTNASLHGYYYCTMSDIESGVRNFTKISTNYLYPGFFNGNTKSIKQDGYTYLLSSGNPTSDNVKYSILKLNSDHTSIADKLVGVIPLISSTPASHGIPGWYHTPQPGRLSVITAYSGLGTNKNDTVFGFGTDLYYNGAKIALSGANRLAI